MHTRHTQARSLVLACISLLAAACSQGDDAATVLTELGASSSTSPGLETETPPTSAAPTTDTTDTTATSTGLPAPATTTGEADTTGTTGEPASSTGAPAPSCGDRQLDPDEECDPGLPQLSQTGACTLACKTAKCGDNLIWADHESCDNGPDNNDNRYGGCTTQCKFGPRCNDGLLQDPEECDLGPDNGTGEAPLGGVPCDNGCRFHARLVFLSSATYKGDIGGVEGAHLKCQNLAEQAEFDNASNFMAWLSDAQHSPSQDFAHGPETAGLPYVRPDGVRIADDWDALVLHGPIDGIIVTETDVMLLDEWAWTGTAPSGKILDPSAHCESWTSPSPAKSSRVGSSGPNKVKFPQAWAQWIAERQWTNLVNRTCDKAYRLYCFEQ